MMVDFNRDERKLLNLEKVVFILAESPFFRVANIAKLLGVSERTCYRYLSELQSRALVERRSRGKYFSVKEFYS